MWALGFNRHFSLQQVALLVFHQAYFNDFILLSLIFKCFCKALQLVTVSSEIAEHYKWHCIYKHAESTTDFSITLSSEISALGCAQSISPCSLIWVHEAGIQNTNQLWEPGKKAVTLNGIQIRAVRIWESPSSKHDLLGGKGGGETIPKLLDSEAWRKLGRSVRYRKCKA